MCIMRAIYYTTIFLLRQGLLPVILRQTHAPVLCPNPGKAAILPSMRLGSHARYPLVIS